MDEKELATLFRAAPGDPPAPGFTLADVTKASARASTRRRSALLAAAAGCVAALLAVGGITLFHGQQPENAASGPSLLQGNGNGPRAETATGCDKVDQALAAALAGRLPSGVTGPSPGRVCTAGARSAGYHVTGGGHSGFVSATVFPSAFALTPFTDGTVLAEQATASGGSLVVLSTPDPHSAPPLESQLPQIAAALAGHF